ncbi:MAG: hypothetical protein Q8L88_08045 [Bacteroidota bacterium]|nr:hypothetical protein [Bacteroidota bacterium]
MRKLSLIEWPMMFINFCKTVLLLFVFVTISFSQEADKKEATKKDVDLQNVQSPKADAPLPKIDLPEFVITGSEKIDLQIESKSEDDEDRIFSPAKPTPGERPMNVGEALSPKQIKSFSKTPSALNGKVFAGFGFYQTPQFDGWFGQYDPTSSFVLNGYYSESQGHLDNGVTQFWRGGFGARGTYVLPESSTILPYAQLNAETKYGREFYRSYALGSLSQDRNLSGIEVTGGIGSRYALPYKALSGFDYSGKLGWSYFSAKDSIRKSEAEFFLNGSATTRFLAMSLRGQTEYRITSYTMSIPGKQIQTGHWFVLRADGSQLVIPSLQLSFVLQQYIYQGNVDAAAGRFYPQIELKYSFTENALMYYGFAPSVERNTLSSIIKQNKYIDFNAKIVPTDTRLNLYAGMEYSPLEYITTTVKLSYKHINNYPTFYDKDSAKVWEVLYLSGVRSTKFDVSTLFRLNQKQNVTGYASLQTVKQKDSSGVLPYIPNFIIGTVYHHFFDFGLHIEAFAEYNSFRFTDFWNSVKRHSNAGFVFSGVKADIELFDQFRGFAELNNLINQQYYVWNGYQERTIFLLLGVSYHW